MTQPESDPSESLLLPGMRFERGLDPATRARLGAYYTCREDVLLLIEPVLMRPLRQDWAQVRVEAEEAAANDAHDHLQRLRRRILERLRSVTVLDPACGAGNFLAIALQTLMKLEHEVINDPQWHDLPQETARVHPRQMFGIEKNPVACELARTVLASFVTDSTPFPAVNIGCMDAILGVGADGFPYHPDWPPAHVIVSNPPFLGSRKLRPQLGDAYINNLKKLFRDTLGTRTPDLVCYWFERARRHLEAGLVDRVGLLATNSIRGGTNRIVLEQIMRTGRIFMAWSDLKWRQAGAAVNLSLIAFDNGSETTTTLNNGPVHRINADLTASVDLSTAISLAENRALAFQGIVKRGGFDLPETAARRMLAANSDNTAVIRPIYNGTDIARRPRHRWIVDFGIDMPIEQARRYVLPFRHVKRYVKPTRARANQSRARDLWWLHWNPRPEMRQALAGLRRYIATPAISKHRIFAWVEPQVHPDHALIVFARDDDYFFGVLHSYPHQLWALRLGTSLEDRPRYTPTTTFETFPFPWPPGQEDQHHPAYQAISQAAHELDAARRTWQTATPNLTLTALYNALQELYGSGSGRTTPAARAHAPELDALHRTLDQAVWDAYGWEQVFRNDEDVILEQLLTLNRVRSGNTP